MMRAEGVADAVPIIMAGGVWFLREWNDWIDNPELGAIAFQFGTRPLLTEEARFRRRGRTICASSIRASAAPPLFADGILSSAVRNRFCAAWRNAARARSPYSRVAAGEHVVQLDVGVRGKNFWVARPDLERARGWAAQGFEHALRTPDDTVVFVTAAEREGIRTDQADCMGCLSHCGFSAWKDHDDYSTGRLADPRSFCIQKTLQDIAHGGDIDHNLMFAGHAAYRFKQDPFYSNNFTPTVKQLVDRILTGD